MRTLSAVLLLAAATSAQDLLFPMGFANAGGPPTANVPVVRMKDIDGDGVINSQTEIFAFLTDGTTSAPSGTNFMVDGRYAFEGGEMAFYFTDTEWGRIRRGVDSNHNGLLESNEIGDFMVFGLSSTNAGLFTPDAVAVYRDPNSGQTRVYAALDNGTASSLGFTHGIWRLVDLNGDGDAMDAGEATVFVDNTMALQVPGNTGPVTITRDYWRMLRVLPNGKVIAWAQGATLTPTGTPPVYTIQPEMNAWYGFTDNNGVAVPEVWFNGSTLNNLPQHPDFANSTFPNWDIQNQTSGQRYCYTWLTGIAAGAGPAGEDVYYLGSSYRTSNEGDVNLNGQHIGGLYYRVLDANHNGTIDAGELSLYANISGYTYAGVAPVTFINTVSNQPVSSIDWRAWSMDAAADGTLHYCFDNGGTNDAVLTLKDSNGNGVIDQGEVNMTFAAIATSSGFPYPFNTAQGPYFNSMVALPENKLPGPFATGVTPVGEGCLSMTTGMRSLMDAVGVPQIGNGNFKIASIRGVPLLPSFFLVEPRSIPTPISLASIGLPGCFSYMLRPSLFVSAFADQYGRSTVPIGLPNSPALVGVSVFFQALNYDLANLSFPFSVTNALQVVIQP